MTSLRQRHENTKSARTGLSAESGRCYHDGSMTIKTTPADRLAGHDDSTDIPDSDDFADDWDDYVRTAYPLLVFDERGEYGQLTGSSYFRCIECEAEMPTGRAIDGGFVHYHGCPVPNNLDERVNDESTIEHRESSMQMEGR